MSELLFSRLSLADPRGALLCIDFVNTVDWRTSDHPTELLPTYDVFLMWCGQKDVFPRDDIQNLRRATALRAAGVEEAFRALLDFREALYRLLIACLDRHACSPDDLALLNRLLEEGWRACRLEQEADGLALHWSLPTLTPAGLLGRIALSAAALLSSPSRPYLHMCEGSGCGWLFVDTSRNHRRRWCDMKGCGNRAKARRHYAHVRATRDGDRPTTASES